MNNLFENLPGILALALLTLCACQPTEVVMDTLPAAASPQAELSPLAAMMDTSAVFNSNITGFVLYDSTADSAIYSLNGEKYFTPASNTKLFTFYAGLNVLPDTLRALEFVVQGDSLIFWGTGDPSFLQRDYGNVTVYNFLKNRPEQLFYSDSNFNDAVLGAGWAWDDYNFSYSAEKSPFPMYNNMVRFTVQQIETSAIRQDENGMAITPKIFHSMVDEFQNSSGHSLLVRERTGNRFAYHPVADTVAYETARPFHYTPELITGMLADTLGKPVQYIHLKKPEDTEVLYSIPADTAYKRMLQPSDNFIAEQLMLMVASELGVPLNTEAAIQYVEENFLGDLPDKPEWADGSGLSQYNMFTPRSIIALLKKIDEEFEDDRKMYELFPAGGESGTIRGWYAHRDGGEPYVFAKTGTLRHNHTLSGFIVTKSGKKLLFSFMNNHYVVPSNVVRREMEQVLWHIYETM